MQENLLVALRWLAQMHRSRAAPVSSPSHWDETRFLVRQSSMQGGFVVCARVVLAKSVAMRREGERCISCRCLGLVMGDVLVLSC